MPGPAQGAWSWAGCIAGWGGGPLASDVLVKLIVGVGVGAIVGGVIVYVLTKIKSIALDKESRPGEGLSLEEIEKLHRDGALSKKEYDRARRAALGLPPCGTGRGGGPAAPETPAGGDRNDIDNVGSDDP